MGAEAMSAVLAHEAGPELRRLRAKLAACQQELRQYQEYLPDLMHKPTPPVARATEWYTIALKARSDMPGNVDNLEVAAILRESPHNRYVRSVVLNASPHWRGCAWLIVKFGASTEADLPSMYGAVQAFLKRAQRLQDCHRICETVNFIDEYDGKCTYYPETRAASIVRRLPEKVALEMHDAD